MPAREIIDSRNERLLDYINSILKSTDKMPNLEDRYIIAFIYGYTRSDFGGQTDEVRNEGHRTKDKRTTQQ